MKNTTVLSTIDQELASLEAHVAQLRQKVQALVEGGSVSADAGTALDREAPVLPVVLTRQGAFHPKGFWYRGSFKQCSTQIGIYLGLLRAIAHESGASMERTAAALRRRGARSRAYLAPEPSQLFKGKTPEWIRAHSRRVVDGWYADTNLSLELKTQLVRHILRASDLRDGVDVAIVWSRVRAQAKSPSSSRESAHERSH